jgi:hypothetical protein
MGKSKLYPCGYPKCAPTQNLKRHLLDCHAGDPRSIAYRIRDDLLRIGSVGSVPVVVAAVAVLAPDDGVDGGGGGHDDDEMVDASDAVAAGAAALHPPPMPEVAPVDIAAPLEDPPPSVSREERCRVRSMTLSSEV